MIAAHVPDLMDRSKFGAISVRFVRHAAEAEGASLVLVDLDRCADVESFAALPARTVGYCSHVDGDRMAAASGAGFDQVLARSVFFRRLSELVASAVGGDAGEGEGAGGPVGG